MTNAHRHQDPRSCGAVTIVTGQSLVRVDGKLWAVEGDQDSHGGGALIPGSIHNIRINGKKVIGVGDSANPDNLCDPQHGGQAHCTPSALFGDPGLSAN
jgi:uncharacterized Zn-binding protein involved in type VI secretion